MSNKESVKKVKEMIKNRLITAYLAFKLSSEADTWTKKNKSTRTDTGSHLERSWLFQTLHRTGIIELCSVIEDRGKRNKETANLSKLKNLGFMKGEIDKFYSNSSEEIQQIKSIRDKYIGHSDINPKAGHKIDSYFVTGRLINNVAGILGVNLANYDYLYKAKVASFASLCLEDLSNQ